MLPLLDYAAVERFFYAILFTLPIMLVLAVPVMLIIAYTVVQIRDSGNSKATVGWVRGIGRKRV